MAQVRVRMYRQGGIGDFFLLSFPAAEGSQSHMLIDCGVLKGTEDGTAQMQTAVADLIATTGGRLDVLVVTHEHWDHVSGFLQAAALFRDELQIGEVWLAWTEDPASERADALREKRVKARSAIDGARHKLRLAAAAGTPDALLALDSLSQFDGDFGVAGVLAAAGAHTTAAAMQWAREGAAANVRYLTPGEPPLAIPRAEGVRAFVFGPPQDVELIKRGDPSKKTPEVYHLAAGLERSFLAATAPQEGGDVGRPFDPTFEISIEKAREEGFLGSFFLSHYFGSESWRQIDLDWLGSAEYLALQLDSDTNNTSLVLALELTDSGRVLLFPADAQVGNWLSWEPLEWTVKDGRGEHIVKAHDLLARTVLYKVGHHGSHNATLRGKGLELMQSSDLTALLPVYREQAKLQGKSGWEMPFGPLFERLQQKTAGRILIADEGVPDPQKFGTSVEATDLYIDYFIDV